MNFHLVFLLKLNLENMQKYKKNISNKGAITKNKLFKREELINLIVDSEKMIIIKPARKIITLRFE